MMVVDNQRTISANKFPTSFTIQLQSFLSMLSAVTWLKRRLYRLGGNVLEKEHFVITAKFHFSVSSATEIAKKCLTGGTVCCG